MTCTLVFPFNIRNLLFQYNVFNITKQVKCDYSFHVHFTRGEQRFSFQVDDKVNASEEEDKKESKEGEESWGTR